MFGFVSSLLLGEADPTVSTWEGAKSAVEQFNPIRFSLEGKLWKEKKKARLSSDFPIIDILHNPSVVANPQ